MYKEPISRLNICSVNGCVSQTAVIIQKKIGEDKRMFGYCQFHSIISATFFSQDNRTEIRL